MSRLDSQSCPFFVFYGISLKICIAKNQMTEYIARHVSLIFRIIFKL